jgi:hypothetical protein
MCVASLVKEKRHTYVSATARQRSCQFFYMDLVFDGATESRQFLSLIAKMEEEIICWVGWLCTHALLLCLSLIVPIYLIINRRTIPVHQRRCCVGVGVEKLVALHSQRVICLALNMHSSCTAVWTMGLERAVALSPCLQTNTRLSNRSHIEKQKRAGP